MLDYGSRYAGTPELIPVLDLLLAHETNPRSALAQVIVIEKQIVTLAASELRRHLRDDHRAVLRVSSVLRLTDAARWRLASPEQVPEECFQLLEQVELGAGEIADALTRAYLTHARPGSSIGSAGEGG